MFKSNPAGPKTSMNILATGALLNLVPVREACLANSLKDRAAVAGPDD